MNRPIQATSRGVTGFIGTRVQSGGFDPAIYVQGSFRLGTAIRPINDAEEYDVDSVCKLKKLAKNDLSQFELKQLLGHEIKACHDAKGMTKPVREGRRCWILEYADGAQFHMDVLPALPNGAEQRFLLEKAQSAYDSHVLSGRNSWYSSLDGSISSTPS